MNREDLINAMVDALRDVFIDRGATATPDDVRRLTIAATAKGAELIDRMRDEDGGPPR
jgi:hypothetical protein